VNLIELTIGQVKKLASILNLSGLQKQSLTDSLIGRYVIVRSRNEGINAGFVKAADETGIVLTQARRIWYHRPADKLQSWYEGVANTGLDASSKVSAPVTEKVIIEDYSSTPCTEAAIKSISSHKSHEQS
jgi:hypothetical protein